MNLHKVSPMDEMFLYEREGNPHTASALIEMENMDFYKFKQWAKDKWSANAPMARAKLILLFGDFYWEQMSKWEFDQKFEKSIRRDTSVKNNHDL